MNDKIDTLLPAKLDKTDPAYSTVLELDTILDVAVKKGIRNIALTGPFGSGKSSVLKTLMTDFSKKSATSFCQSTPLPMSIVPARKTDL